MPWCSSARESPFFLVVGSKEAEVTAEMAQSKAEPYPACWTPQPVCHEADVCTRLIQIPVQDLNPDLCIFHYTDEREAASDDISASSQCTVHPAKDGSWLCTLDTPNPLLMVILHAPGVTVAAEISPAVTKSNQAGWAVILH